MDDLLSEFLTETTENLSLLDVELVNLEQNPTDGSILGNIFRLVHTIKGTSGFLGLPRLESVAHAGENVLGKFRDGELEVSPQAVTLILRCMDSIRDLLTSLEETGAEPEGDDSSLIEALNAAAEGGLPAADPVEDSKVETASAPAVESSPESAGGASEEPPVETGDMEGADAASVGPVNMDAGFPVAAELLDEVAEAEAAGVVAASDAEIASEIAKEVKQSIAVEAKPPTNGAGESRPANQRTQAEAKDPSVASQSIRVNVETLESLMNLVGELVLTRNQLLQMIRSRNDSEFVVPLQRLSHITTDLQEGVMKTRMQPIGNAWAKLPRIVRDLAVETGRKIELKMLGADTELDRQVLELIKDPLTHMVRNSADHGIEKPADRILVGKPETGTIMLNAFHEGGHIIIQIIDDGKGLDVGRICQKIIEKRLATESELESMVDQQILQYIFRPGFSTAETVTNVSGRGVGMDVVRTNIEKIGGTVDLKSEAGKGVSFTIKIPLTLAIVSALIVNCGGQRFALPQINVLELVRASGATETRIEMIKNSPVLRLRDRLLPLVDLRSVLRVDDCETAIKTDADIGAIASTADRGTQNDCFVVVTQVGEYTFGMMVDGVYDTEEIVVKPLAPVLRELPYYSGNTILGDGSVIMILDPGGMAGETSSEVSQLAQTDDREAALRDETMSLLLFRAGGNEPKAVPLELVARLEEINVSDIERSQNRALIQYRGRLMPLVPCDPYFEWPAEGRQPVLVFVDGDQAMGLVVDQIVDIVEERLNVDITADSENLIGSAIVNGRATDVIDVSYYVTAAFPDWFGAISGPPAGESVSQLRVLLVDDSAFFRNMLVPKLEAWGCIVTAVPDAASALNLREEGRTFDAIVSDIEMPVMDGFRLAEEVRSDPRWASLPLIALSSHATEKDFQRGREAGFSDYVAKFDRDGLTTALSELISAK
ncbi:MAG: chemotaxis protein CheW [Rhodospirillales bacterium]|nr:chemotaxis protein CheW [Rhodospirillales bacterium]